MYANLRITLPHVAAAAAPLTVDTDAIPLNVRQRLIEIGVTQSLRSAINSARSAELAKAETDARAAHEKAGAKDAKGKLIPFNSAKFQKDFTYTTDAAAVASERLAEFMAGTIRAARGASGANKILAQTVRSNILAVLKSKGKGHKEAAAMVGDDPFAFIEKTARKRAGEGEGADERFNVELAKLNAQYVDPARALLAPDEPEEGAEEGEETEGGDAADDLV